MKLKQCKTEAKTSQPREANPKDRNARTSANEIIEVSAFLTSALYTVKVDLVHTE